MFDPRSDPNCRSCREEGRLEKPPRDYTFNNKQILVLVTGVILCLVYGFYTNNATESTNDSVRMDAQRKIITQLVETYRKKTGFKEKIELVFGNADGWLRTAQVSRPAEKGYIVMTVNPYFALAIPDEALDAVVAHEFGHLVNGHVDTPPENRSNLLYNAQETEADIESVRWAGIDKATKVLFVRGFSGLEAEAYIRGLKSICKCQFPD